MTDKNNLEQEEITENKTPNGGFEKCKKIAARIPWGIILGVSLIFVFFLTVAVSVVFFVFNEIAKQTNDSAGFLDSWWQKLLFSFDVIFGIVMIVSIVMLILKNTVFKEYKKSTETPKPTIWKLFDEFFSKLGSILFRALKVPAWSLVTFFLSVLMVIAIVGNVVAADYATSINTFLKINPYVKVEDEDAENEDTQYYKSDFLNADGTLNDKKMRQQSELIALQTAVEGSVLLWNDEALPLKKGANVSVFGKSAQPGDWKYVYCGEGSGKINNVANWAGNLRDELKSRGLGVNPKLWTRYSEVAKRMSMNKPYDRRLYTFGINETPWSDISATVNETVASYGDAAIMVLSRTAGEYKDIADAKTAGDYTTGANNTAVVDLYQDTFVEEDTYLDLTVEEDGVLKELKELKAKNKIKKIVLLLNTANPMQMHRIRNDYGIDACVWVGQGGNVSFPQIADVLTGSGDFVLSGHLTDTYANYVRSAPAYENFGDFTFTNVQDAGKGKSQFTGAASEIPISHIRDGGDNQTFNQKYVVYQEGIYVGYRYYETRYADSVTDKDRNAAGPNGAYAGESWNYSDEVAFPFGYGMSYTEFAYSDYAVKENEDGDYEVSMTVKNVGKTYSGKEVLQVYLQKPYTDYDRQHQIEKSAVELVGFAKTKKLAPGESETLTVTVEKENFKTYDAYGQKTYILEKGKYYLAAGTNAHDALNNILAAKGFGVADGMDYEGKAALAHLIDVAADDFETYSVSSETQNKITNLFDDADLNLYEGTAEQKITYLSRSDWDGTYPSAISLHCDNKTMAADMTYGEEPKEKEGDEMPVYGKVTSSLGSLTLLMLKDFEYDDPQWQDLLNQMTLEEQQIMVSNGFRAMAGAESISAPGANADDGPAGIRQPNETIGTVMCFPCPVLMASTFDKQLIEELGVAYGNEAMHLGYTVAYAPGANIHRFAYGGRNWEYYSEDSFLSGAILATEIKGMQSKGLIVITKHFALNEQEMNRYGVATFANEQSIREIYVKPFEIAITQEHMNGVMSSLNRIGLTWTGAHYGLLTGLLRNEWGFTGIVETDAAIGIPLMTSNTARAEGIVAGNDLWMDNLNKEFLTEYKDNATVMLALREACHRILYNQLHSSAMNGISSSTRVVKVQTWWEAAIITARTTLIVLTCLSAALLAASIVIRQKPVKRKLAERRVNIINMKLAAEGAAVGMNGESLEVYGGTAALEKYNKKKKICVSAVGAGAVALAVAITLACVLPAKGDALAGRPKPLPPLLSEVHECEYLCPVCGGCIDDGCEESVCSVKCGDGINKNAYTFEAENAKITNGTTNKYAIKKVGDITYIENLHGNNGAKVTFFIKAERATTATLVVSVSKFDVETVYTDTVYVTLNDDNVKSTAVVPAGAEGKPEWTSFNDKKIGCIQLQKGVNVLEFTNPNGGRGYNFDAIRLISESYLEMTEEPPAPPVPHDCTQSCTVCGKCLDATCDKSECVDKCENNGTQYKYEAEKVAVLGAGVKGAPNPKDSGGKAVGNLSENKGATLTFKFHAANDCTANLYISSSLRDREIIFTNGFEVTVNGVKVLSKPKVPATGTGANDWSRFVEINLGCIALKEGENTVVITVATEDKYSCTNIDYLKIVSPEAITEQ